MKLNVLAIGLIAICAIIMIIIASVPHGASTENFMVDGFVCKIGYLYIDGENVLVTTEITAPASKGGSVDIVTSGKQYERIQRINIDKNERQIIREKYNLSKEGNLLWVNLSINGVKENRCLIM